MTLFMIPVTVVLAILKLPVVHIPDDLLHRWHGAPHVRQGYMCGIMGVRLLSLSGMLTFQGLTAVCSPTAYAGVQNLRLSTLTTVGCLHMYLILLVQEDTMPAKRGL